MKYIFTLLLVLGLQMTYAQFDTLYIAVLPFQSSNERSQNYADAVRSQVIEMLSADYRITLLERDEFDEVSKEREYQKSEEFIDGKIVEQGKAIGAEYLLGSYFDSKINQLSFSIYDVSTGAVKCSAVAERLRDNDGGALIKLLNKVDQLNEALDPTVKRQRQVQRPSSYQISLNVRKLLNDCFPAFQYWTVVRPVTETGSKVKELLIAAGSSMKLKKGTLIEVLVETTLEIDGEQLVRYESAGWGRVTKVESDKFSILKLEAGAKNIKKLLKKDQKLKCRYIKK